MKRRLTVVRAAIASLAVVAFVVVVPGAAASGEAVLWACHGPSGEPLGAGSLTHASSFDGQATSYGDGCDGGAASGGLRANFSRLDPQVGSGASWAISVPGGTLLNSVRIDRTTSGFGGVPVAGASIIYTAATDAAVLETERADAASSPADGVLATNVAGGRLLRVAIACTSASVSRCATPSAGAGSVDIRSLALGVRDDIAPRGAVGGLSSPVTGTENLTVRAVDDGLGLSVASATIDGTPIASVRLGDASCADLTPSDATIDLPLGASCPLSVSDMPLPIDTRALTDGAHRLQVLLSDAAGNTSTIADETVTVANTPRVYQISTTLTLGGGGDSSPGDGGDGGGGLGGAGGNPSPGTTGPVCLVPSLSMALRDRPLRRVRGTAVVKRRGRYRFAGRLTCRVNGKRVAAPRGVGIEYLSQVGKRQVWESGTTVQSTQGRVSIVVVVWTTRTLIFRYRSPTDARSTTVKIKMQVEKKKPKAKKK